MFHLGSCYSKGIGTKADQKNAIHWWTEAVEAMKHPSAAYNLGLRYENGYGVSKNAMKAFQLFKLAADGGHVGAMYDSSS